MYIWPPYLEDLDIIHAYKHLNNTCTIVWQIQFETVADDGLSDASEITSQYPQDA